jgi:hypothetical protein
MYAEPLIIFISPRRAWMREDLPDLDKTRPDRQYRLLPEC